MSCCGNPPKEKCTDAAELRLMLAVLRDQRTAWKTGDGLTTAGTVIGQYKKTIAQFEALIELIEHTPMEEAKPEPMAANPDCLGRGGDNVPGCTCRLIRDSLK
jgi:hypothetical protein